MNGYVWVLIIAYWVGLYVGNVWLCFKIAAQKNRNDVVWGWLAVFFGIIATSIVAGLPPLKIQCKTANTVIQEEEKEWKSSHARFYDPKMKAR